LLVWAGGQVQITPAITEIKPIKMIKKTTQVSTILQVLMKKIRIFHPDRIKIKIHHLD